MTTEAIETTEVVETPDTPETQDFLSMSDEEISQHSYPPEVSDTLETAEETPEEQPETTEQDTATETSPADAPPESTELDYENEYKRLLAPFKANGKDIQVTSVDEALTLMQMGANYNKKMAALKPNLKVLKLLDTHGLLDENELNFLIDLKEKNPKAIMKLVKDSGIDPMEMDVDTAEGYKPNVRTVNEKEMALDDVIAELSETPSYSKTIDVVGTQWDEPSRKIVAENPQLLRIINDHVASGVYPIIEKEMERNRVLGKLNGLSDIDAYRQIGDAIQARGGFDHLGRQGTQTPTAKVVPPKPRKEDDPKLRDKKLAAAPPKSAPSSSVKSDFNPLSLSDEEFAKLSPKFV